MTYREITSVNAEFEAMDMVKIRGEGRPLRVHKSGDGRKTFLYPDWPGRNRHERRRARAIAR